MYPEFIAIYVGLAIVLVVAIVNLILTIKITKQLKGHNSPSNLNRVGGVVFCKKCATEFDSSSRVCPNCGTVR